MIEAVGLSKHYFSGAATVVAVDDLHLRIPPGEVFGFLGENGAGKTTTIKMLTGLIPPTAGIARIAGFSVAEQPGRAKQRTGYIPDNPPLYERLTGHEFLDFVADLYRAPPGEERRQRQSDLLALFDLSAKADILIGSYSRGMRQKIMLAAALQHNPEALFLDEPTVGLDPKSTRRLHDVLKTVSRTRQTAVFLSTHVLTVAEELCDRIGILHRGRLIRLGTPRELTAEHTRSLEDVFLECTGAAYAPGDIARLLGP